ncbi:four helix bundle protein [Candidatus Velamenicoccus archaeovorus]|uniref:four helix bundle protein n=1 Tax=Velamenicoccus archaeovorus TaxID=1930593 RepID=UPI0013E8C1DA|nr:four helix bundle protein [Candidatus Velamenicoccus archaeovorus]
MTIKRDIVERTYSLALRIIKFVKTLPKETSVFVLGRQLVASGTSIAANVEEAQGAFSKDDFIYKMQTAFKEALETNLWLRLIFDAKLSDASELKSLLQESTEIKKILASIVKNSKK